MLRRGKWMEGRIKCPYCGQVFKPRVFTDPLVKQCPYCHRYFYYQKVAVRAKEGGNE